jgi:hypothetical protein
VGRGVGDGTLPYRAPKDGPCTRQKRGVVQRTSSDGAGNSIFLSIRPGRSSAGSKMSMRLVAMMTYTRQERQATVGPIRNNAQRAAPGTQAHSPSEAAEGLLCCVVGGAVPTGTAATTAAVTTTWPTTEEAKAAAEAKAALQRGRSGCGGHLDVLRRLKAVQLVEELKHGALHLAVATPATLHAAATDGVYLVHENDGGRVFAAVKRTKEHGAGAVRHAREDTNDPRAQECVVRRGAGGGGVDCTQHPGRSVPLARHGGSGARAPRFH